MVTVMVSLAFPTVSFQIDFGRGVGRNLNPAALDGAKTGRRGLDVVNVRNKIRDSVFSRCVAGDLDRRPLALVFHRNRGVGNDRTRTVGDLAVNGTNR